MEQTKCVKLKGCGNKPLHNLHNYLSLSILLAQQNAQGSTGHAAGVLRAIKGTQALKAEEFFCKSFINFIAYSAQQKAAHAAMTSVQALCPDFHLLQLL